MASIPTHCPFNLKFIFIQKFPSLNHLRASIATKPIQAHPGDMLLVNSIIEALQFHHHAPAYFCVLS